MCWWIYKDDKYHGKGTFKYADGSIYVGEYEDGKRHGRGKWTNADTSICHDGMWEDGKPVRNEKECKTM